MNITFLYVFLASLLLLPSFDATLCNGNDDCEPHECCVRNIWVNYCRSYKKENEHCHEETPLVHKKDDVYLLACPCAEGLKCVPEKTVNMDGETKHLLPKCIAE
ncbi:toxin CSTX-20-like isoform X1 [Centruroides sculpturatus]|uniref:toxin CSTX-20-like isoform X1 n=1 Tax=Centruroides sculpturatus TaxID=218467 RepID=UPI000C6CD0B2|nr:toxin CSTX-20-like isoform X1 [Centruroides sculpturatus]